MSTDIHIELFRQENFPLLVFQWLHAVLFQLPKSLLGVITTARRWICQTARGVPGTFGAKPSPPENGLWLNRHGSFW